jgi:hypothetical protein
LTEAGSLIWRIRLWKLWAVRVPGHGRLCQGCGDSAANRIIEADVTTDAFPDGDPLSRTA